MKNKKELKGYWRLPEEGGEESEWIGGIATFDPGNKIKLELFSNMSENILTDDQPQFDRIFGWTTEGEKVTLQNCIRVGFSSKAETETYAVRSLFIGDYLQESDPSFDRFRVSYPLLYQWAQQTGIKREFSELNEMTVEYSPPPAQEAETEEELIRIITSGRTESSNRGKITINEETYLEINPKERMIYFSEIKDQVSKWKDFTTIATNENIGISELAGYQETDSKQDNKIEIYYNTVGNSNHPEQLNTYTANFTLADIEENLSNILINWMELSDRYESVYDLYFAVVYQSQMYLENQYMMLMTALNLVYQQQFSYQYLSEDELQDVMRHIDQALPAEVNQEFRSHLIEEIIPAANQYSIEKVLTELVDIYEPVVEELPWEFNQEIAEIVAIHDYTAGRSHELQKMDSQKIYDKTVVLRTLLEAIILNDIGIPEDHIREKLAQRYGSPQSVRNE